MAIKYGGLHFIPRGDGGVTVQISENATENAPTIREAVLTPEQWLEITESILALKPVDNLVSDLTPGAIATVISEEAIELVNEAQTEVELDKLQADEENSQKHPGGRKGVLEAIMKRREELNAQE